ncbi:MAG: ABC transporter permease subunit [Clostridia bacterium]|nr:ABC transporter permease subunit [Clostridia bacterium]
MENKQAQHGRSLFIRNFKKNWQLHLIILVPLVYLLIFEYGPMVGLQIAFRDYRPKTGIWGSTWVGLKHFKAFLTSYNIKTLLTNTLSISLYSIFIGFPIPIIFALLLHVTQRDKLRRVTQNIAYMPHFISIVVMVGILDQVLNPVNGLIGTVYHLLGNIGYPADVRSDAGAFRHLYVWSGIWQNMGWDTIIYVAALSAVSQDQHEAAEIDGASRWQRILHVDIPAILPTIAIMLILRCGSVMSVGYEKAYLMQNDLNLRTSEVISTYVYKVGLGKNQLSYAAAIGMFNSVINCVMLVLVNFTAKKASDGEQGLF